MQCRRRKIVYSCVTGSGFDVPVAVMEVLSVFVNKVKVN